jgi:hypothetical protein
MGIDQYNQTIHGIDPKRPKASLLEKLCASGAVPMYRDKEDGSHVQCGYVVTMPRGYENLWVELYKVEPWHQ